MISAKTDNDNGVKGGGILVDEGPSPGRSVVQQCSPCRYLATVANPGCVQGRGEGRVVRASERLREKREQVRREELCERVKSEVKEEMNEGWCVDVGVQCELNVIVDVGVQCERDVGVDVGLQCDMVDVGVQCENVVDELGDIV